jgi:gliding motility-associated-like protein
LDTSSVVVVVGSGATVYYIVQIEECLFEDYSKVSSSYPGILTFDIFPDSIADCQEVTVTVDVNPANSNSSIIMETIVWEYVDSLGNVVNLGSDGLTVTHFPTLSGKFKLSFQDSNGCFHEYYSEPIFVLSPVFDRVPNVFSPNHDGMNDRLKVLFETSLEYEIKSFRVYNRWGNLIFEDNSNDGWDGKINGGEDAQEEVYLYVIELEDACGNGVKPLTGDVTLIR